MRIALSVLTLLTLTACGQMNDQSWDYTLERNGYVYGCRSFGSDGSYCKALHPIQSNGLPGVVDAGDLN